MIRSIIALLITLVLFVSCGPRGNNIRIQGTFEGMETGQIYIYNQNDATATIDTLTFRDGSFTYNSVATEPTAFVLVLPNAMEHVIFAGPGQSIKYKAITSDLRNYVVTGSEENDIMTKFRQSVQDLQDEPLQDAALDYVCRQPHSVVTEYIVERYLLRENYSRINELPAEYATLKSEPLFKFGDRLPDITLQARGNRSISVNEFNPSGSTLILFWNTTMDRQYEVMMQTRRLQDDGKVKLISVSLETNIDSWQSMTRMDSIEVANVCDGEGWNSPVVKKLRVRSLPCFILLDSNHKVLLQTNSLDEMLDKLR